MNIQEACQSGKYIRRDCWGYGEIVMFNPDHATNQDEPEFTRPVYYDFDGVYINWIPTEEDRAATDWVLHDQLERPSPGANTDTLLRTQDAHAMREAFRMLTAALSSESL